MSLEIQLPVNWDRQTKMVSGDTADDARFYKFPMTIRIIVLMIWKRINPKSDLKIIGAATREQWAEGGWGYTGSAAQSMLGQICLSRISQKNEEYEPDSLKSI